MCRFHKQMKKLPPWVQASVNQIIEKLQAGDSVRSLDGKLIMRTKAGPRILSLPVGQRYRVLLKRTDAGLVPDWVGSHEAYNNRLKRV